jgi:hypothetical protein
MARDIELHAEGYPTLCKGDELTGAELPGPGQFNVVQSGPKPCRGLLLGAKQVDLVPEAVAPTLGRDLLIARKLRSSADLLQRDQRVELSRACEKYLTPEYGVAGTA